MNTTTDLILIGTLAAVWLAAGLIADTLPDVRTARELRRRSRALSMMVGAGAAVFIAVPIVTALVPGSSAAPAAALIPAVPAMFVLTMTARRLSRVRRGSGAFAAAPLTPAPPALRAAAAHPWVAVPLQVTGLAALVGVPIAGGLVELPGSDLAAIAVTVVGIAIFALVVRHAIRHSRLSLAVLAPLGRSRQAPASAARSSESWTPLPDEQPAGRAPAPDAVDLAA
ncbi:hypothetical protein [Actinoplanes sp. N902-109]|uniref:hypothetical protein n=1 Tax=Actinoplanes sp. (strain N902-109) TaxID=649831 RepID=UPI00032965AB|nr:hypothetical protein [Actinoplanes sp. N902-109]AGL13557.1 hypothetical protein L083_0047 [Actinoplanes sp. N902-109]